MDKTIGAFFQFQAEAQERFEKQEEERVKREMELEERHRREDKEHQERMIMLIGQMLKGQDHCYSSHSTQLDSTPLNFEY